MILTGHFWGFAIFQKFILLLNLVTSAFPIAYRGVSERMLNDNIP
jgi:hypothetical protein